MDFLQKKDTQAQYTSSKKVFKFDLSDFEADVRGKDLFAKKMQTHKKLNLLVISALCNNRRNS